MAYLYIILGAAAGAPLRHFLQGRLQDLTGMLFPIGTLVVNVSGCLFVGFVVTLAEERGVLDRNARLALITGFIGSYTTYSTYAIESVQLFRGGEYAQGVANILATLLGGLVAAWIGISIARRV